jgi:hypothetical protein
MDKVAVLVTEETEQKIVYASRFAHEVLEETSVVIERDDLAIDDGSATLGLFRAPWNALQHSGAARKLQNV